MLPSKGYFKNEPCPFFEGKSCERPFCHFRHKKYDTSNAYLATLRAALDDFQLCLTPPDEEIKSNGVYIEKQAEEEEEDISNKPVENIVPHEKVEEEERNCDKEKDKKPTEDQLRSINEIVEILKTHPSRIRDILSILKRKRSDHKSSSRSSSHRKSSRSDKSSSSSRRSSSHSSRKRSSEHSHSEPKKPKMETASLAILPESSDDDVASPPPSPSSLSFPLPPPLVEQQKPRISSLMQAPNAPKTRICPAANVLRMLRAPAPKVTISATTTTARIEHSNGQWCPFLVNITEGSSAVPAVKRNVVSKRLFTAFMESGMFFSKGEAGQEATKCESQMYEKHRDSFRKYQMMLPSVLSAIKQGRYLAKDSTESDELEWYNELLASVLTEEQLVDNGFPLETIDDTGQVVKVNVYHNTAFAFNKKWKLIREAYRKGLRFCVRCNMEYKIDQDTMLQLVPNCVFHSERIRRQRGDRFYPCCHGDTGCQSETYHVTDQLYENMENVMKSQPPKPGQVYHKILALDCEMVATTHGMELAHVVIVNLRGKVVFESHVKPTHTVTSYLTQFSGMTQELLERSAKKDLSGIHKDLMKIITSETILIGHSLDSDLRALRLVHTLVIDTSVLYPPHEVNGDLRKQSLKRLAAVHLMRAIQNNEHGHSAMEDAVASLELAKKKVESKMKSKTM